MLGDEGVYRRAMAHQRLERDPATANGDIGKDRQQSHRDQQQQPAGQTARLAS